MPHRKPELTLTSRMLISAAGATERWRPRTQWTVALSSLAAVCAIDAISGAQVTFIFLYILISGFAAWSFGERKGMFFALLAMIGGAAVRRYHYALYPEHSMPLATELLNIFTRTLTTGFVVVLVSGMRGALHLERWRASTDGLTGVLNKGSFHERMASAIAAARGSDRAFILCYMDLDGFKLVNDRHGHSAGDEILRIFANGSVDAIREGDLFARIGGDEFVALLTIPDADGGDHIAALVHRRISGVLAQTGLPVGCSMGALVATPEQLEPLEAAIQFADSLMYEVKRSGKAALRVGRIDENRRLVAPDGLNIQSDMASPSTNPRRSAVIQADRRAA